MSEQTLTDWIKKQNDVVSICIVNKFCISKTEKGIEIYKYDDTFPEHWETLNFSLQMFNYLSDTLKNKKLIPLWGAYLQGVDKFKELNNIK